MRTKQLKARASATKREARYRVLRVGAYPRKGDQFFYVGETNEERRGWQPADVDLLAAWRGPVPAWYRGRYRRRVATANRNR